LNHYQLYCINRRKRQNRIIATQKTEELLLHSPTQKTK